jgi:hypothetical protein
VSGVPGVLGPATVNGVMPTGGLANRPGSTDVLGLGCRAPRTVAVAIRWISVAMAPSVGTMEAGSPPLVCSDDDDANVQEPTMEELSGEEPSYFRQGLTGSSEEWRPKSHW